MQLNEDIMLVGAGPMAIEYAKVLQAMNIRFVVVGRSEKSATKFFELTGIKVFQGGLGQYIKTNVKLPPQAIVCVTENNLGEVTRELLRKGVKSVLVEKPGGLTSDDIQQTAVMAKNARAEVFVAYNRRFYASVKKAREIIEADGGVLSFHFDFTEWSHVIAGLEKAPGVKEEWFLANSTHVIDLAFYLGGKPTEISCFALGGVDWHPSASIYSGAGKTNKGALFSYHANWEAPGRWSLEIMTRNHRLIFKPIEKLHIQKTGSVVIEECSLNDDMDTSFKPGLYRQVSSFLEKKESLITVSDQIELLKHYSAISHGWINP
jgi:predicted dehydrogenase